MEVLKKWRDRFRAWKRIMASKRAQFERGHRPWKKELGERKASIKQIQKVCRKLYKEGLVARAPVWYSNNSIGVTLPGDYHITSNRDVQVVRRKLNRALGKWRDSMTKIVPVSEDVWFIYTGYYGKVEITFTLCLPRKEGEELAAIISPKCSFEKVTREDEVFVCKS